jgi:uncharacterized RDD family membrane protein YckC
MNTPGENPFEEVAESVEASPATTESHALASRLTRLGAAIIDSLISCVVWVPVMFATGFLARAMEQKVTLLETALWAVVGIPVYLLLHGYFLATRGQSIGKIAAGARIVDYESGKILPLGKLVGLRLVPVIIVASIPMVGSFLNLIDTLFIFGNEQRCVHDLIAGTKVVQA